MKVLILGGDGYLGWPTAMYFSSRGHEVTVVDNYYRKIISEATSSEALLDTPSLPVKAKEYKKISGNIINYIIGDLSEYNFTLRVFKEVIPDTIIHYAEQPSAPYSMRGEKEAIETLNNNLNVTLNCILATNSVVPNAHIIKLGTMGEYGTPNIEIEEGWINIEHKGRSEKFLFPRAAGSLYHTTKVLDTDLLWFYVKTFGLRVTDLMQGPVYGFETDEAMSNEKLYPHFHYDDLFGTVINRFITQAVVGVPLTVYGKGGQTRGYLNIKDTLSCVYLAAKAPANKGELRIFNQFTETFSVNELAEMVREASAEIGINVQIQNLVNPRKEAESHFYKPAHTGLFELGLKPHLLDNKTLIQMIKWISAKVDYIDKQKILPRTAWNKL